MGNTLYFNRHHLAKLNYILIFAILLFALPRTINANQPERKIELARTLEGEAAFADCGFRGLVAIAHVHSRNQTMYGYAKSSPQSRLVAEVWHRLPDPTNGALYIFGEADLWNNNVYALIASEELKLKLRVRCNNGSDLFAYGR